MPILAYKKISKENMMRLLQQIADEEELIAPVEMFGGEALFQPVRDVNDITFNYVNTLFPPKQFLLPRFEKILTYKKEGDEFKAEEVIEAPKRTIFGIRSCDVEGIRYSEFFYSGKMFGREDLADPHFMAKRHNLTLISVACLNPAPTCFCVCCDGGPFLDRGFDLQLTDLGDFWLIEVGSEKGTSLVEKFSPFFSEVEESEIQRRKELEDKVLERFGPYPAFSGATLRNITRGDIPRQVWESLGERCIVCGGWQFLCPLCFCYTVVDIGDEKEGYRARVWDSCHFEGYSRLAGGPNPRKSRDKRRERCIFHKFSWQYVERMGRHGCVGCGRCVITCMGYVHMPQTVWEIRSAFREESYKKEAKVR